ncbi:tRNA pseudouridine synthase A [Betaproteobacteria bacterium]|nr:tRNA pseudouridine synthase A [Betaproteobacteria bacterium]GHU40801.1 tRNA pseudouridine synthase A [Betaproteobacteria bacterium]
MTRIALGLEYDGRAFHGWQRQKDLPSVQAALENALTRIADHPIGVLCAGRTDTGVHASAQVVHFDTLAFRPLTAWVRGVNALLPSSVAVLWAKEVNEPFHARYSACRRRYRYVLLNRPQRPGLLAGRMGWFHAPLALDAMRTAAQCLLGEHDFSAFRAAGCQAKSPVKRLTRAEIRQEQHATGAVFVFDFEASAFLHHMVRNLVGSLVYVGKGAWSPEYLREVLASRNRTRAAPTFSPDGLYFQGPVYDPALGIPEIVAEIPDLPLFPV